MMEAFDHDYGKPTGWRQEQAEIARMKSALEEIKNQIAINDPMATPPEVRLAIIKEIVSRGLGEREGGE